MLNRKHNIRQIRIPEPCHQLWNDMQPTGKGRYCESCSKIVTDFTGMSNQQIIDVITNEGNICGRVENWQLSSINRQLSQSPKSYFKWKGLGLAASLLFALPAFKVSAQQMPKAKTLHYKHIVVKSRPIKQDSLVAHYLGYQPDPVPVSVVFNEEYAQQTKIDESVIGFMGAVTVVRTVSQPVTFFRDGSYQRIYDLIQSVIKQTF